MQLETEGDGVEGRHDPCVLLTSQSCRINLHDESAKRPSVHQT
jgi:hypothetical protein